MRRDIAQLRDFYASPRGQIARRMIGRKIWQAWGQIDQLDILGIGYPTPFLEGGGHGARRIIAAMPAAQGVEIWPEPSAVRSLLVREQSLPLPSGLFDRVLAVHAIEEADEPGRLFEEIARVLAPAGRVMVVAAARSGLWAHFESTPFGHGRSFSRSQLEQHLHEAGLEPTGWSRALYAPPSDILDGWEERIEAVGSRLVPALSGVILMEAVKHTRVVRVRPRTEPVRILVPGGRLSPTSRQKCP